MRKTFYILVVLLIVSCHWSGGNTEPIAKRGAGPVTHGSIPIPPESAPISAESIRALHQALVDIATRAGGLDSGIRLNDAGREAADYLLEGYGKAGLANVRFEEFFPRRWWPETYSLAVIDEAGEWDAAAFPLWFCEGADNLELDLEYAGFGTKGEFRGKNVSGKAVLIDMKRLMHFTPSFALTGALETAVEKGASAVIVADTRVDGPSGAQPQGIEWDPGKIEDQKAGIPKLVPLPVFLIGKTDGLKLKDRLKNGRVRVRANLKYSLAPARAVNVVGELHGNGEIDEHIIVGGHYDSWFGGAVDNLGSQAGLLEMAKYFAAVPREQRKRNIIFVSIFGHEFGNRGMGQAAFVERHADELLGRVTCFLNIDGSGSWGWEEVDDTGVIRPTGMADKAGIASTSWALAALAHEAIYPYAIEPWTQFPLNWFPADLDGPISEAGWPCMLLISKHIYYHSPFDTIDRISPDQVYRRTLMNIHVIAGLMDSPAGYYIGVDTNPSRKFKENEVALQDLTPDDLPKNPRAKGHAPRDLSFHVIPHNPKVLSKVIVWPAFAQVDEIALPDSISWDVGGLMGLKGPIREIGAGTMFLFPGQKTITMTVTDRQGRTASVSRTIEVTF
jgi:hypothetical protein